MGKSFSEIINEMITMPNIQWPEVWTAIVETLYMTVVSTIFAFILGLILGVLLFLSAKGKSIGARLFYSIVSFIVNLFRAIPFIILILLLIPFTSLILGTISGPTGALPALIIGAAPFYARLVEIAFKEIDKGVIEAAWSMGANTWTVIRKSPLTRSHASISFWYYSNCYRFSWINSGCRCHRRRWFRELGLFNRFYSESK